jgi:alpha-L-fucosidase
VAPEIRKMPEAAGLYGPFSLTKDFIDDYVARWTEIETKYQPDFMWLDHIPILYNDSLNPMVIKYKEAIRNMIADYLNTANGWGKKVYFNNKGREVYGINFPIGAGIREADNVDMGASPSTWQNPATIAHSYGYNRKEEEEETYKPADELISLLVDMVSKNGNLLLNVGPRPDGTISETQRERLLQMGAWLEINGEAIFGTHPWKLFGEGPTADRTRLTAEDIRFTSRDDVVYAIVMDWPDDRQVKIESLAGEKIRSIELLGSGGVEFQSIQDGLNITFPEKKPCNHAYTLKITIK